MKTLTLLILIIYLLSGCGADQPDKVEGFIFTCNGTKIAMNATAEPVVAALGEPLSYTEEASCAFDGMDKTYSYSGFCLTTYPDGSEDRIYSLWFTDDSVSTEEGIYIGSPQEAVEKAYGPESWNGVNAYILTRGDTKLTILLTDGTVSSIKYETVI